MSKRNEIAKGAAVVVVGSIAYKGQTGTVVDVTTDGHSIVALKEAAGSSLYIRTADLAVAS